MLSTGARGREERQHDALQSCWRMIEGQGCPLTSLEPRTSDWVLVLDEGFIGELDWVLDRSCWRFSRRAKTRTRSCRGFSRRAKTRSRTRWVVLSPRPTALTAAAFVLDIMWWKSTMAMASPTQNSVVWWAAENAIARQRGFCHKFILKKFKSSKRKGCWASLPKILAWTEQQWWTLQPTSRVMVYSRRSIIYSASCELLGRKIGSIRPSVYPTVKSFKLDMASCTYLQMIFQSMLRSFLSHKQASTIKFNNLTRAKLSYDPVSQICWSIRRTLPLLLLVIEFKIN